VTVALLVVGMLVTPPSIASPSYHGVQVHSLWGDTAPSQMPKELDLSQQVGANVVRLDVGWSSLETQGKGELSQWYVDKLDAFMTQADQRGIKVIVTLMETPCWASSAPESAKQGCAGDWWNRGVTQYPPNNPADYGDIAKWVTNRYGSKLAALEVWNEPDLPEPRFWKSSQPAADYAALVRAAYAPAKAGNADVPVLAGALAGADAGFLKALYANGIQGHYDGISIHPYNEWRDPTDMWQDKWKQYTLVPGTKWVHDTQVAAGDNTPLWLTELGWPSCQGMNWCVSQSKQALYTAKAVQVLEGISYVKAYTFYDLRNEGNDVSRMDDNFGIVDHDYNPKPVFASLKDAWKGTFPAADSAPGSGSGSGSGSSDPASPLTPIAPIPVVATPSVTVTAAGVMPVPVSCPAGAQSCAGTVTIATRPIRTRKGGRKKTIRIGARNVRVRPGNTTIVKLSIPRRYRALMADMGRVRARVTVSPTRKTRLGKQPRQASLTLFCAKLTTGPQGQSGSRTVADLPGQ
jgi:hypothetical protein